MSEAMVWGPTLREAGVMAAGAAAPAAELQRYLDVVNSISARSGVTRTSGDFVVDSEVLRNFAGYEQQVRTAAIVAGGAPFSRQLFFDTEVRAAGADDLVKKIGEIGGILGTASDMVEAAKTLANGTKHKAHWWGVVLEMTDDAAKALAKILTTGVPAVIGLFSAITSGFPVVAAIVAVLGAALAALGGWVGAANKGHGAALTLVFWAIPFVSTLAP